MKTITVDFKGICTFVSGDKVSPALGAVKRVVLVNASRGRDLRGVLVPPHFATVEIATPTETRKVRLRGCTLSIVGPPPLELFTSDASFAHLTPDLTKLIAPIGPLGPPSAPIVSGEVPEWVAAYFDITGGSLSASMDEGVPPVSSLVLRSDREGEFYLKMVPFPEAPATELDELTPLPAGTTVTISNSATTAEDKNPADNRMTHFFLHYLVAGQWPVAPQLPPMPNMSGGDRLPGSMGCSNSTYP